MVFYSLASENVVKHMVFYSLALENAVKCMVFYILESLGVSENWIWVPGHNCYEIIENQWIL